MWSILYDGANVTDTLYDAAVATDLILAETGPDSTRISPAGGTAVYTNTEGLSATAQLRPGSVATTQTVSYVPVGDLPTDNLAFALAPQLTFSEPVTVTIYYRAEDVAGMDEGALRLHSYHWPSGSWVEAAPCGGYITDTVNRVLQAAVCRFGDYVLMDWAYSIYLPLVLRAPVSP
jgi:hypothetical protein